MTVSVRDIFIMWSLCRVLLKPAQWLSLFGPLVQLPSEELS